MSRKNSKKATDTATETSASTTNTTEPTLASDGMSLSCPRGELYAAIRRLAAIAPKKSTLPILGNVLIRADLAGVIVAATDLDVWGIVDAPTWHVVKSGAFTVNAKALSDVLAKMPEGKITLTMRERFLVVAQGPASVLLEGMPAQDFPKLPAVLPSDTPVPYTLIDAPTFKEALATVAHAMCKDQTRFHLAGVWIEYGSDRILRTVATDGHRLVKFQRAMEREGDFCTSKRTGGGIILPAGGAKEIRKILGKGKVQVALVGTGDHQLAVRDGGQISTTIVCKLTDAQFPPYEQVIPKENTRLVTVDRKAMLAALDRAKLVASTSKGVRLEIAGTTATLACSNPDTGETREAFSAECRWYDDTLSFGFNPKYLAEILDEIDDERVTIGLSTNDKICKWAENTREYQICPITIRATADAIGVSFTQSKLVGVVMPMRM